MSPKFKEENGFVFKIYSNEEERKHVHVIKAENEAKFWLEPQHNAGKQLWVQRQRNKKYH